MGFWQGLNAALDISEKEKARKEELAARQAEIEGNREFQREMFTRQMMENYRGTILEQNIKRQEQALNLRQKVETAVALGLGEDSAVALLQSNQLDLFLSQYQKNERIDPQYIKDLDLVIREQLKDVPPETLAGALIAGVSTGRDVTDPQQSQFAMTEAILTASTPEDLDKLYTQIQTSGPIYTPLPRFEVDFSVMSGPEEVETKAMRRELAEGLSTYFKDSFTVTNTGDVVVNQNAAPEVQAVFNEAERRARDMAFGPTRQFSPTDASRFVVSRLETVLTGTKGTIEPSAIVQNFDTILKDPMQFMQTYVPPPVTTQPTPEAAVEGLGNMGIGSWHGDAFTGYNQ